MIRHLQMWSKKEADTSIRGLPFYVRRQTLSEVETRQKATYVISVFLVIAMLCIIFRFSAADATHSSHLSEGVCIRIVREISSVFPEQFPKAKMIKIAQAIEYPVRKCAHFSEYAVLSITVNLYLWICYSMEILHDKENKKRKKAEIKQSADRFTESRGQSIVIQGEKTKEQNKQNKHNSMWSFLVRAELFCALYACSDELHQYFVPGRSCRFFDVCVDSAGAFCGALLFWGLFHLANVRKRKRQEISNKSKS